MKIHNITGKILKPIFILGFISFGFQLQAGIEIYNNRVMLNESTTLTVLDGKYEIMESGTSVPGILVTIKA